MADKFLIQSLLGDVINDTKSKCKQCPTEILTKNLVRHYEAKHAAILDFHRPVTRIYKSKITTAELYQQNLINIMATTNLPFTFWSNIYVRENQELYTKELGVPCSAHAMGEMVTTYSKVVRTRIAEELRGQLISIKFDIATRKHRKVLGISVQFMNEWHLEIRYLGMVEVPGKADHEKLRQLIEQTMYEYGLDISNVYSCTTDNGGNVLLTATNLLADIDTAVDTEDAAYLQRQLDEFIRDEEDEEEAEDLDITMDRTLNLDECQEIDVNGLNVSLYVEDEEDQSVEDFLHQEAARMFGTKETRCGAHVIQLAVNDFLKQATRKKLIDRTQARTKEVRNYLRKLPPGHTIPFPALANTTRWSSTFYMVCSLLFSHETI